VSALRDRYVYGLYAEWDVHIEEVYNTFLSIHFLPQFEKYSPEEIRLGDYYSRGQYRSAEPHIQTEGSTAPAPSPLVCSSSATPRVRLPPITNGTINIHSVNKLQDELEQTKVELLRLGEKLENDWDEALTDAKKDVERELRQETEKTKRDMENRLERNATAKAQEIMEQTLKTRSENMVTTLNKKLEECKETQRVTMAAELEAKKSALAAEFAIQKEHTIADMSDIEMRKLLADNQKARAIISGNVKKKAEEETAKVEVRVKLEYEELAGVVENANRSALMEGKKHSVKTNLAEGRSKRLTAKLEAVELAARNNPSEPVGGVWARVYFTKPQTAECHHPASPASTSRTAANAPSILQSPFPSFFASRTQAPQIALLSDNSTAALSLVPTSISEICDTPDRTPDDSSNSGGSNSGDSITPRSTNAIPSLPPSFHAWSPWNFVCGQRDVTVTSDSPCRHSAASSTFQDLHQYLQYLNHSSALLLAGWVFQMLAVEKHALSI
jgi:hypothetical protein